MLTLFLMTCRGSEATVSSGSYTANIITPNLGQVPPVAMIMLVVQLLLLLLLLLHCCCCCCCYSIAARSA